MIKKVIHKSTFQNLQYAKDDLAYWLSRPAEERVAAVDYLRKQYFGTMGRLKRVVRVVQLEKSR